MKNETKISTIQINVWYRKSTKEWVGEVNFKIFHNGIICRNCSGIAKHTSNNFEAARNGAIARMSGDVMNGIYELEENYDLEEKE